MLYRFREAQSIEMGTNEPKQRRPHLASQAETLGEAERWRRDVIREISRSVSRIHDLSVPETQIRDLNDEINKLLRIKGHWEKRVLELGGPDYRKIGPKMLDHQDKKVPGNRGYKYFGRAKDLPGVRELFDEQSKANERQKKKPSKAEMLRRADAMYFGYRDENDGDELLEYERKLTEERIKKLRASHDATLDESSDDSSSNDGNSIDDSDNE